MASKKYCDFLESAPVKKMNKHFAKSSADTRLYVSITCPHCKTTFVEIAVDNLATDKASRCLKHLRVCASAKQAGVEPSKPRSRDSEPPPVVAGRPVAAEADTALKDELNRVSIAAEQEWGKRAPCEKRPVDDIRGKPGAAVATNTTGKKRTAQSATNDDKKKRVAPDVGDDKTGRAEPKRDSKIITIYALVFLPTGMYVYTGKTGDPDRRLAGHASRGSKCRLVRNAFRKHGRKSFSLEPLMRCHESDADTNESFWILKNKTLYPDGYNLRHGSMAGEEFDPLDSALVPQCTGVIPFAGFADEAAACSDAWADVAAIAEGMDDTSNDTDALCKDLLRQVHPDAHGGKPRAYTADEVTAMLNAVRESIA